MLEDFEENAEEELKRADHLIYVTLKYTKTVDVIKNTIKRLINSMDFAVKEGLEYLKVKNISDVPRMRFEQLLEKIPKIVENEAARQVSLLEIKEELHVSLTNNIKFGKFSVPLTNEIIDYLFEETTTLYYSFVDFKKLEHLFPNELDPTKINIIDVSTLETKLGKTLFVVAIPKSIFAKVDTEININNNKIVTFDCVHRKCIDALIMIRKLEEKCGRNFSTDI